MSEMSFRLVLSKLNSTCPNKFPNLSDVFFKIFFLQAEYSAGLSKLLSTCLLEHFGRIYRS